MSRLDELPQPDRERARIVTLLAAMDAAAEHHPERAREIERALRRAVVALEDGADDLARQIGGTMPSDTGRLDGRGPEDFPEGDVARKRRTVEDSISAKVAAMPPHDNQGRLVAQPQSETVEHASGPVPVPEDPLARAAWAAGMFDPSDVSAFLDADTLKTPEAVREAVAALKAAKPVLFGPERTLPSADQGPKGGPSPSSTDAKIREAEERGDLEAVVALKLQKAAEAPAGGTIAQAIDRRS